MELIQLVREELSLGQYNHPSTSTMDGKSLVKLMKESNDYREELKQHLFNHLDKHLQQTLCDIKAEKQREEAEIKALNYAFEMKRMQSLKADLCNCIDDTKRRISDKQKHLADMERQHQTLVGQMDEPELDEAGLRVKIYRGLGFDVTSSGVETKFRVRNGQGNDVRTFEVDEENYSKAYICNHLWNMSF